MKRIILIVLLFFLSTFLSSCVGPGLEDYSYDVAGGYMLVRSSGHQIEVVPKDGWDSNNPPPMIPPKVIEIAWDDRFVITKQLGLKRAYPDNPDNSYEIPDDKVVNYWILDTKEKKLFGPLNKSKFDSDRKELGVPEKLKLKSVSAYDNRN